MLVYVATTTQIHNSFVKWIEETGEDERKIVHRVFEWFMSSSHAKNFKTGTGLISFSYNDWENAFNLWISEEIVKNPEHEVNIRKWSNLLIALLSSDWGLDNKLIVK